MVLQQSPKVVVRKLAMVTTLLVVLAVLVGFRNILLASGILVGALVMLVIGVIHYNKLKSQDPTEAKKVMASFYIYAGAGLLLLSAAIFFFEPDHRDTIIFDVAAGLVLLAIGIAKLRKHQDL